MASAIAAGLPRRAIGIGITVKTNGKSTNDAYSPFEYAVPTGVNGPPPHLHARERPPAAMYSSRAVS